MIPLLIVDDESIIRETIAAMLRRKYPDQFHIFLASNGQEALSLVASENVELVLADIKMPVMNGLELLHRLHEQQLQCDVIFISGFDDVERPAQVSEEHWKQLLESRSKMTVWSLTMISRVFYAAAASRATRITARPTVEHVGYCRTYGSGVCPACQGEQNTVFERTVA